MTGKNPQVSNPEIKTPKSEDLEELKPSVSPAVKKVSMPTEGIIGVMLWMVYMVILWSLLFVVKYAQDNKKEQLATVALVIIGILTLGIPLVVALVRLLLQVLKAICRLLCVIWRLLKNVSKLSKDDVGWMMKFLYIVVLCSFFLVLRQAEIDKNE